MGAQFEAIRVQILTRLRDPKVLAREVLEMREKMRAAHPNKSGLFDVKHDRGGMIDIEFAVQYLVLGHAHGRPELTRNAGNIALLKLAAQLGLIPVESAESVGDAYRDYRRRQHWLRLNGAKFARVPAQEVGNRIDATRLLWSRVFGTG